MIVESSRIRACTTKMSRLQFLRQNNANCIPFWFCARLLILISLARYNAKILFQTRKKTKKISQQISCVQSILNPLGWHTLTHTISVVNFIFRRVYYANRVCVPFSLVFHQLILCCYFFSNISLGFVELCVVHCVYKKKVIHMWLHTRFHVLSQCERKSMYAKQWPRSKRRNSIWMRSRQKNRKFL